MTLAMSSVPDCLWLLLLRTLLNMSSCDTCSLTEHSTWKEIILINRLILHSSFENGGMLPFIPEVFFIMASTVGLGTSSSRRTIHAILINIIQSLLAHSTDDKYRSVLNISLRTLGDAKYAKLFGLEGHDFKAEFPIFLGKTDQHHGEVVSSVPIAETKVFISLLKDVMLDGMEPECI